MYQAPAAVWNQIAEEQPLQTTWAQQMFPLPAEELMSALASEEKRLTAETGSAAVAASYLKMAPLLWEQAAISNFLQDHPDQMPALGQIPSTPSEGVDMASGDFSMTPAQRRSLLKLLSKEPT